MTAMSLEETQELQEQWEAKLSADGLGTRLYKKQIRGKRGTPERAQARQREVVLDSTVEHQFVYDHAPPTAATAPVSFIQALMETPPHGDQELDRHATRALRDALLDALTDILGEDMVEIVTMHYYGRTTINEMSTDLGIPRSTLESRIKRATDKIVAELPSYSGFEYLIDPDDNEAST